jgi:hypothetical protein
MWPVEGSVDYERLILHYSTLPWLRNQNYFLLPFDSSNYQLSKRLRFTALMLVSTIKKFHPPIVCIVINTFFSLMNIIQETGPKPLSG